MFHTLLIANRGEIACRIARTAKRLGIEVVAVYSEADASALHVRVADRAVPIGAAPAHESYLNIARIIEAARYADADAIHPGYGFLAENPDFADACVEAGIAFVGPPAAAMRLMGSKAAAKALMERAGVPILPGYHGEIQDEAFLAEQADRIGYPLVIKGVAGGGGRGMRVAESAADFPAALASARQESATAFGNERVLIERYLSCPRHIEVQVFGDVYGNIVHLFERDCSLQRRHQKLIEESPAPGIDACRRAHLGAAAIAAARACGYVGAGTVEFVANDTGFFFLEMNTRLQVEHPVTEMITGFDLVEWQVRVAAGEALPAAQDDIRLHGHAIEARLYAEDPARDFAPTAGRLIAFHLPASTPSVRIDAGYTSGDIVSTYYDAMLAKVIAHGATRGIALGILRRALADCAVVGVAGNFDMLFRLVSHPDFAVGGVDTGFIARNATALVSAQAAPSVDALAAAALGVITDEAGTAAREAAASADPYSPWHTRDLWWLNLPVERVLEFIDGAARYVVRVRRDDPDWVLTIEGQKFRAGALRKGDGWLEMTLDSARQRVLSVRHGNNVVVHRAGESFHFHLPDPVAQAEEEDESGGRLVAPLPGQITAVLAEPGESVTRGQLLVVMEAMKTVFRLVAPADEVVERVACRVGETVQEGQILIGFAGAERSAASGRAEAEGRGEGASC